MNISDQFLPQDIKQATKELKCAYDLLEKLGECVAQTNYDGAILAAEGIIRSSRELEEMKQRKATHEHYVELIDHLKFKGVNAEIVLKQGRDYYGYSR